MTLRRFGLAVFALALAAAAVQVPACEFDPTSPSTDVRQPHQTAAPAVSGPVAPAARVLTPTLRARFGRVRDGGHHQRAHRFVTYPLRAAERR